MEINRNELDRYITKEDDQQENELYENAVEAATKLFSDPSVSQSETRHNLEELIGEIRAMIDTLKDSEEG